MAKIATSKQTGGGGFDFEDKVSAYFLTKMLSGNFALDHSLGSLKKIAFQVRPDGWLLDDLLLTFNDQKADHLVAVSAKSNRQITGGGLPDETLNDIWNQFLNIDNKLFDQDNDYLLFIVSPIARSVIENLTKIIKSAQNTDAATLAKRMRTTTFSQQQKTLFDSFTCPEPWRTSHKITDEDTCRLLSRLIVVEFDFQNPVSKDELQMIAELEGVLRSKLQADAQRLYARLKSIRSELAPHGGFLDYLGLLARIINDFELDTQPAYGPDWEKIAKLTAKKMANIPDKIGGKFAIERPEQKQLLYETLAANKFVFLTGKSGFGKTVLAKQIAEEKKKAGHHVIWLDADLLQQGSFKEAAGLNFDTDTLISITNSLHHLIVVDGADRFFKENLIDNLMPFIRQVAELNPVTWRMLITCQSEDYENLLKLIYRKNAPALNSKTLEIQPVDKAELLKATAVFPQLIPLFKHDHLLTLLGNLKYLDIITYHVGLDELMALGGRLGESKLIDWIWQQEITDNGDQGYVNSRFLQEMAGKQADLLTIYTPVTDFKIEESAPIAALKKMKLIGETGDRLYFIHDLFGDWARYKTIRSKGDGIKDFLLSLDLASPLWGKAIRLYGIYLLETEKNASAWLHFFNSFSNSNSKQKLIRTLLLEAIIFSNATYQYLEDLWPELAKEKGELLNQFFDQFLIRGTAPDPAMLKLAGMVQGITVSELATLYRLPIYNYWFSVLRFLKMHAAEIMEIARGNMIKIVTTWLDKVPQGSDFRNDMARIAVDAATWLFDQKENGVMVYSKAAETIYEPMLKSFSELPDEVTDLSLKLARRKKFRKPNVEKDNSKQPWYPMPRMGAKFLESKFAPDEDVDEGFRTVCLETSALQDMMIASPELAKEILLALLIKEKGERESSTTPTYGLKDVHGWFPPFYTRGPFLSFLIINEAVATDFIVELTNLAAENWKVQLREDEQTDQIVLVFSDGTSQEYFGDERIYFWFRDYGNASHALVSALMALEKHLLNKIDAGQDATATIRMILEKSKSVALLGILSSLGKYKQDLFTEILKPMLAEIKLLHWEMMLPYGSNIEGHQLIGAELLGQTIGTKSQEWHQMPHRRKSIQQTAHLLFFNKQEIRDYFENTVVPDWIKRREKIESEGYLDPYLDNMIGQFNIDNYVTVQHENHITIEYREPETITEKLQEVRQQSNPGRDMEGFSFKISQEIEKGKIYTLEEIEEIWNKIQNTGIVPQENYLKFLHDPEANVFAAVAVILMNRELIEPVHPDYIQWAITQLDNATSRDKFDYRGQDSMPLNQSPSSFQAIVIPALYRSEPYEPRVRRIIANFTLKSGYPVIETLFENLAKQFSWADPLFIRVQNIYIQRCHLVHNLNISVWDSSDIDFDTLLNPPFVDFVERSEERPLIDIATFRKKTKAARKAKQKRKHGIYYDAYNDPGFDVYAYYKAFSKLPPVSDSASTPDDKIVLLYYASWTELLVYTWGKITPEKLPFDEYPTESDKWIAFRLAKLFVTDIDQEDGRKFWQPLMAYGNLHHKWLEEFTLQLVYANMGTEKTEILGVHWNAMIDFAFAQQTWGSDKRFHNGASLWESLLGISKIGLEIWKLGYVPLITMISKQLLKWFNKQMFDSDEIEKLCQLMKSPCVDLFLKPGVLLVNLHLKFQITLDEAEVPKGLVRVPFKYNETVASMCSHIWEHKKNEMLSDKEMFAAFKEIVIYLVARQNATGLELQERLLSMK